MDSQSGEADRGGSAVSGSSNTCSHRPGMRIRDELNATRAGQNGSALAEIPARTSPQCLLEERIKMLIKQFVIVLLLSSFSSVSTAEKEDAQRVRDLDLNGSDCIWIRTIRDYRALDSRNLLIYASGKSAYFVRLARPSMELRSSIQVGFSSRDDRLCPYGGDQLVVGGFAAETVSIRAISRISSDQADVLLVRFGKKDPDEQQIPAPREVEGAEIEELD